MSPIKAGSSEREVITVTNNSNDGEGSLRWALRQTQEKEGQYDIVFASPSFAQDQEEKRFDIGYWEISLSSPLPNLYRSDIRINPNSQMPVHLISAGFQAPPPESKGEPKQLSGSNQSSSMLIVGDIHHLGYPDESSESSPPEVSLNRINFVGNRARGGDGGLSAGGGGASGGAITLIDGELTIEDSVFQSLASVGGQGGRASGDGKPRHWNGTKGARTCKQTIRYYVDDPGFMDNDRNVYYWSKSFGENGGSGGFFNLPLKRLKNGDLSYTPQPSGGKQAKPGGFHYCSAYCSNEPTRQNPSDGHNGASANLQQFGFGGGGEGGSSGAGVSCRAHPYKNYYGENNSKRGQGGKGNGLGGDGGGAGDAGRAVGSVISLLGHNVGKQPKLNLNNVDIWNSGTSQDQIIYTKEENRKDVSICNSFFGEEGTFDQGNPEQKKFDVSDSGFNTYEPEIDTRFSINSLIPYKQLVSSPTVHNIVKEKRRIIKARPGFSDVINVEYELMSSTANVFTDMTDPSNPLNEIWTNLYESKMKDVDSIAADYDDKIRAQREASKFNLGKLIKDTGFDVVKGACEVKGKATKVACKLSVNAVKQLIGLAEDESELINEKQKAVKEADAFNQKLDEQRNEFLEERSAVSLGKVDLEKRRTWSEIEDFSLGEDIIILPWIEDIQEEIEVKSTVRPNEKNVQFTLAFQSNSNMDIPFLTVKLSEESRNELQGVSRDDSLNDQIKDLIHTVKDPEDENSLYTVLGLANPNVIEIKDTVFASNMGSQMLIVDRDAAAKGNSEFNIRSRNAPDFIYGSIGPETINAGGGDDLIAPISGKDTVNGSWGFDRADYHILRTPLTFTGSAGAESLEMVDDQPFSKIKAEGALADEGDDIDVDAMLINLEMIDAYGASEFDFSGLPAPYFSNRGNPVSHLYDEISAEDLYYRVASGSGTSFLGSDFNDVVDISFVYEKDDVEGRVYNDSVDDAYSPSSHSSLVGGEGDDYLRLDFSGKPEDIKLSLDGEGDSTKIFSESFSEDDSSKTLLLEASGFELLKIEGAELAGWDQESAPSVEMIYESDDSNDTISGSQSDDYLMGMGGMDVIKSYSGNDTLIGGGGDDVLSGGGGHDVVEGGKSNDALRGGRGNDLLRSGPGSDILLGGPGNDTLRGGSGPDLIHLSRGLDVVQLFSIGEDVVRSSATPLMSQVKQGVLLSYPGGQTLLRKEHLDDVENWLTVEAGGLELLA